MYVHYFANDDGSYLDGLHHCQSRDSDSTGIGYCQSAKPLNDWVTEAGPSNCDDIEQLKCFWRSESVKIVVKCNLKWLISWWRTGVVIYHLVDFLVVSSLNDKLNLKLVKLPPCHHTTIRYPAWRSRCKFSKLKTGTNQSMEVCLTTICYFDDTLPLMVFLVTKDLISKHL